MIKDLVINNRSCRGFDKSYTFSRKELEEYIDTARLCASSANVQPLKYYLACDSSEVLKIQKQTKWAGALPDLNLPYDGQEPTAFIIICIDTAIAANTNQFQKDVGIVAQTILLEATENNLGGCMIGNFQPSELKKELSLADNICPMLVVALGKPIEKIVLTDVKEDGKTAYYRDEAGIHYVPKRALKDEIINN